MKCGICFGVTKAYAVVKGFHIAQCTSCGFGQTDVVPEDVEDFYESSYFSGQTANFAQSAMQKINAAKVWWIDEFVQGDAKSVLEIGPGPAAMIAKYLNETRSSCAYEAVEVSHEASEALRHSGFIVHTGKVYSEDISLQLRNRFDTVIATEVIEHDLNPYDFVKGLYDALVDRGRACLTTGNLTGLTARWKGRQWYYLDPPAHVAFFTPKSASILFRAVGFKRVTISCVGLKYVRLNQRLPIPGFLKLVNFLQVPTGMTIVAEK